MAAPVDLTPWAWASCGSLLAWWLAFAVIHAVLTRRGAKDAVKTAHHTTNLIHAVATCSQCGYVLLLSDEAATLRSDLYGYSPVVQRAFAISVGFFAYDLMWGVIQRDWQFILHGLLCGLCYVNGATVT